ncbi:MAG: hypothetical protein ACJAV4_000562 [Pontimonas sp.]
MRPGFTRQYQVIKKVIKILHAPRVPGLWVRGGEEINRKNQGLT